MESKIKKQFTWVDVLAKAIFWLTWILLLALVVSLLILPIYMFLTSLKADNVECVLNPMGFPKEWKFENYSKILEVFDERMDYSIDSMFFVSIVTSGIKPLLGTLVACIWGYVEAKYDFVGRKFFFSLGIVLMILPIVGATASAMQLQKALGIYDNLFMHILTCCSGGFYGTNFLLMYGAFKAIPWDYAEAAQIDGANPYTIFFSLYLRMVLPQAVVLYVLGFMANWNDYSLYLVWLPSYPNISYGMYLFNQRANAFRVSLPQLMAGFCIVMIPIIIIYLSTQKIIMSKFAIGGLKG